MSKDLTISIRVSEELHKRATAKAEESGLALSTWARIIIESAIENPDLEARIISLEKQMKDVLKKLEEID